jgi:hypothetical protein
VRPAANGIRLGFGAHILDVRSAPMLAGRRFRLALTDFLTLGRAGRRRFID